ncbi:MFS transporter [Companilactobacillus hulinensis]|uniref:MFS transporter n=1 Tax=Companilactobacillus hulinensis TaxID=2486007 RepID=UPI001CDBA680|nr:MFS transporter [Companilactobacillus hulinensis]
MEEVKSTKPKMSGKNTKVITALMIGYTMVYMDKTMISTAIIPLAKQFSLNTTQTGLIMSAFFLAYSCMQIPGGWLADKVGAKKILLISLGSIAVTAYLFGIVSSLFMFVGIRFLAGLGHGGYPPSTSKAIAENFEPSKRVLAQTGILTTTGIGGILAYTLGANVIELNWRYGYYMLGTLFLIALFCVLFMLPNDQGVVEDEVTVQKKMPLSQTLKNPSVILIFIVLLLENIVTYGAMSWMPSYLTKTFDLTVAQAGAIMAVSAVLQIAGSLGTGIILTKVFVGKQKQFIITSAILAAFGIGGLIISTNLVVAVICVALSGMFIVSTFAATASWPQKIFPEEIIGSASGIVGTGGTLGGFIAPLLIGALVNNAGGNFSVAFIFMGGSLLAGAIVSLFVKEEKERV